MTNTVKLMMLLAALTASLALGQRSDAAGYKGRCHSQNTGTDLGYVYSKTESGLTAECAGRATKPMVDNILAMTCIPHDDDLRCKSANNGTDQTFRNMLFHFCVGKPPAGKSLIEGGIAEADHIFGPKPTIGRSGIYLPKYYSDVEVDIYCKVWNSANEIHWCTGPINSRQDCFYGAHDFHSVEAVTNDGLENFLVVVNFRNASYHEARNFQILAYVRPR